MLAGSKQGEDHRVVVDIIDPVDGSRWKGCYRRGRNDHVGKGICCSSGIVLSKDLHVMVYPVMPEIIGQNSVGEFLTGYRFYYYIIYDQKQ